MTGRDRAIALNEPVAIDARLLGAVTVSVAGRQTDAGSPQQQLLSASLFAAPGRLVTNVRLIDQIWDESPPTTTRELLYALVSDLRGALKAVDPRAAALIQRGKGGYTVQAAPEQVDLYRFGLHLRQAQALADLKDFTHAAEQYQTAIDQWGGTDLMQPDEPLAGLHGSWVANLRSGLEADYRAALLGFLDAEVQLGRHEPAIPLLHRVTRRYPDDEDATGLDMIALYRAGRSKEALASYHRLRARLNADHDIEPSRSIKQLQEQILRQDPDLDLPIADSATADGAENETSTEGSARQDEPQPTTHSVTAVGTVTSEPGSEGWHTVADHRSGGVYVTGGRVKAGDIAGRDMLLERRRRTP